MTIANGEPHVRCGWCDGADEWVPAALISTVLSPIYQRFSRELCTISLCWAWNVIAYDQLSMYIFEFSYIPSLGAYNL